MRYVQLALCFPNISDVMVLQNVNLSEDKIRRPPLCLMKQTWNSVTNRLYTLSAMYISTAREFHMYIVLAVLNFSEKITLTCSAFNLVL
jgi:hypothetical protein